MPRTPPHLATLTLLTALSVLSLNMILPSLPAMAHDLQARESVIGLVVSGYMLLSAVFQIVLGPVSDRLGRRPVMLGALALYLVASLGCMLAQNAPTLLAFRVLQGVIVAGSVISNATVRDQFGAREAAGKLGAISAAMALAPMLGPMLGGFLDMAIGWRAVFGLYSGLGAAVLLLVWVDLGETRRPGLTPPRRADYAALLRAPRYWAFVICYGFSLGGFYVFITGVPHVASAVWGLSPALIGIGVGSITGGYMLGAAITARVAPRSGVAPLIVAGRLIPVLAMVTGIGLALAGLTHPLALFGVTIFVGVGNGLTIPNANAGALSVRPDLAGTAAGLGGAISVTGGAALTALTSLAIEASPTPLMLMSLILAAVLVSLAAGLIAIALDRQA